MPIKLVPKQYDALVERVRDALARIRAIYGVWTSNLLTDELKPVQEAVEPKLAAFQDRIYQNAKLFGRVEAVYNARTTSKLSPE